MKKALFVLVAVAAMAVGPGLTPGFSEQTSPPSSAASSELRIDLNTASATELAELRGIGKTVAARIVAYRKENGRFQRKEEIMNVKGIGEKIFARIQANVFVEAESKTKK